MSSIKEIRSSDSYAKKMMRLGTAMRRYSEHHLPKEANFNSLALEIDALEELSLSAFSLMKLLKQAAQDAAKGPTKTPTCFCNKDECLKHGCKVWPLCPCHRDDPNVRPKSCIIRPGGGSWPDGDEEDR